MEKIKVSLLLPSLNVADYIEECLQSVMNQTLEEIEILCIDAGSTDGTLELIEQYARIDSRIRVLRSEKRSYGYQMNLGIDEARGEYIGIVETDDYVPADMYENLYKLAKEQELDLLKADFYRFTGQGETLKKVQQDLTRGKHDYYNRVIDLTNHKECYYFLKNTWCGIYRKGFLQEHGIRHNESPGASYQDTGFWFQTFMHAKRAYFVDQPYYMYRIDNENSSSYDTSKIYCICDEYEYLLGRIKEQGLFDEYKYIYTFACFTGYWWILNKSCHKDQEGFFQRFVSDFKKFREEKMIDYKTFYDGYDKLFVNDLHAILNCPEEFYQKLIRDRQDVMRSLGNYPGAIIFGWDNVARYVYEELVNNGLAENILCFGTRARDVKKEGKVSLPLICMDDLDSYSENYAVLVAMRKREQDGAIKYLREKGFKHILAMPDLGAIQGEDFRIGLHATKENLDPQWLFPYHSVKSGSLVLLYGAGHLGRMYREQLQKTCYARISQWVDSNYRLYNLTEKETVESPSDICRESADVAVVAMKDKNEAHNAYLDLLTAGFLPEDIVWEDTGTIQEEKAGREDFAIPIVYAADENVAVELSASILSLAKNAASNTYYDITVLVPEQFDEIIKAKLSGMLNLYEGHKIRFVEIESDIFPEAIIHTKHLSKVAFYRLLISNVLSSNEKCIYLDCDTLVLDDLNNLYSMDLSGYLIAGVKAAGYFYNGQLQPNTSQTKDLGIPIDSYVNSGVLLMNLKEIQENDMVVTFLNLMKRNFKSEDQDVLNVACHGRILNIPPKFNVMAKYFAPDAPEKRQGEKVYTEQERSEVQNSPIILHFANAKKPWNCFDLWKSDLWFSYATQSPLFTPEYFQLYPAYQEYLSWQDFSSRENSMDETDVTKEVGEAGNCKVSVIIPVYNMDKFLPETLQSVILNAAMLGGVEIILVDDGSTDNSLEIAKACAGKWPFIRVYQQDHKGSGGARNLGMSVAKGEFIAFMDADDFYPEYTTLRDLYATAKEKNVLICGGTFAELRADGFISTKFREPFGKYVFPADGYVDYDEYQYPYGYQRFLYRRDLLVDNHICFPDYLRFQDPPFFVKAMITAKHFYALEKPTYVYRWGHKNIVWDRKKALGLIGGISDLMSMAKEQGYQDLYSFAYLMYLDYATKKRVFLEAMGRDKKPYEILAIWLKFIEEIDEKLIKGYSVNKKDLIREIVDIVSSKFNVSGLLQRVRSEM